MKTADKPVVALAFSGGLDTTYCALWLREQGYDVHTVTVQTGGFAADELAAIAHQAARLGVAKHVTVDATQRFVDRHVRYLLFANALRGDVYPLSVSAERTLQAQCVVEYAAQVGAAALAHGSTGAGNDQIRFDVAFRVLAPDLRILTPIRDQALHRSQATAWLAQHGIQIASQTTAFSINRGLWGTTIGGGPTHAWDGTLPEEAYSETASPEKRPNTPETMEIGFERGIPVALDGHPCTFLNVIRSVSERAGRYGIGRGIHVGDTILGFKARVAFEAPAAITLIAAHRELEKLTLSRQQLFWKRTLGEVYGNGVHEARHFDPLMRDLEAFLDSSQRTVSGVVKVQLRPGSAGVLGANSPHALLNPKLAVYGESTSGWSGAEAAAFAKLYGLQDALATQAGGAGA